MQEVGQGMYVASKNVAIVSSKNGDARKKLGKVGDPQISKRGGDSPVGQQN